MCDCVCIVESCEARDSGERSHAMLNKPRPQQISYIMAKHQLIGKISPPNLLFCSFSLFTLLLLPLWVLVPTFPPLDETNISSDTSTHYTNSSSQTVCKYKLHDNATR